VNKRSPLSRRRLLQTAGVLSASALLTENAEASAQTAPGDTPKLSAEATAAIDAALGKPGRSVDAEAVYTVALPRADLKVTVKGDPVPTPLGFGGWVSFKRTRDGRSAVLMSDTVLLQEEVNPLMDAAQRNGLEISALHNHFFYEEPRIFYMHLHGSGDAADLAKRYAAAIRDTKLFPANQPPAGPPPARTGKEIFDLPALDKIVGYTGAVNGPTYKYTIGRADLTVLAMGAEITAAIGMNSWAAFAGTADNAHVAGDIAMLDGEVNPVIRTLRANGLQVVALHHHMLGETPRTTFLHYYGRGTAAKLAIGFRAALNELGKRPAMRHD
jgi:hypothetical protein